MGRRSSSRWAPDGWPSHSASVGFLVSALELSPHMADRLRAKPGADAVRVTIGDMTTTRVPGTFALVYLVANTIMNVTTQDEQVSVFADAAARLHPGGRSVVELIVPQLRAVPRGEMGRVFTLEADHVGIETFDDLVGQIAWSHHWMEVQGRLVLDFLGRPVRGLPSLDLMARLAGLRLRCRWADWERSPFTSDSASQVAVFEKRARSGMFHALMQSDPSKKGIVGGSSVPTSRRWGQSQID